VHLSAGDLLRDETTRKGPNAQQIEDCMKNGQLVPVTAVLYVS
jgi:adenylate kinase family enzyme